MIFNHLLVHVIITLAAVTDTVIAQGLPCPPSSELANVVDTAEKCMCFYALAGSADNTRINDNTVLNLPQVGQFIGYDGISEYREWTKGEIITDNVLVGQQLILDMTGSTKDQCVVNTAERRRFSFNPKYVQDNQDMCVDLMVGTTLYYTMTGNRMAPITVQTINALMPSTFISEINPLVATKATARYVCRAIVKTCKYREKLQKSPKQSKNTKAKAPKQSYRMKECEETFNSLPDFEESGDMAYIDGNTRGCRVMHSVLANDNSKHCPHISFQADNDINGLVKCNESKKKSLTEFFTQPQIGLFTYASSLLGFRDTGVFGDTGVEIKFEACPSNGEASRIYDDLF